jgi:hypothetical protein
MRSHVTFQPGEQRSCTGCHESQNRTPSHAWTATQALQPPPQTLTPPAWGAERLLGYEWLIQPIFDRHCVRCHGAKEPGGQLDLTARRAEDGFLQSFRSLFGVAPPGGKSGRVLVSCSDRFSGGEVTRPLQFGSHQSPLVRTLGDDLHRRESPLPRADWIALVTWIDANAPYYDAFFNKRPPGGGPPRRDVPLTATAGNKSLASP